MSRRRLARAASLCCATLLGVAGAWPAVVVAEADDDTAEASPESRPTGARAPAVVVSASRPIPGAPSAFAAEVRVHEDARPGDSVGDLLERLPGATVRNLGGPGQRTTLSLRGSSADQVAVFLDGLRLTPPAGGGFDFSLLSPEVLERIEVIRGGDAARFGSGAVGGVVRLWSPTPDAGTPLRAELFAGMGSFTTFRSGGSVSGSAGPVSLLMTGGFSHTDGSFAYIDDNGRSRARENARVDRGEVLARGRWVARPGLVADALLDLFADRRGVEGPVECPSLDATQRNGRSLLSVGVTAEGVGTPLDRLRVGASGRYEALRFRDDAPCIGPRADLVNRTGVAGIDSAYDLSVGDHDLRFSLAGDVEHLRATSVAGRRTRLSVAPTADLTLRFFGDRLVLTAAARLSLVTSERVTPVPRLGARVRLHPRWPLWLQLNGGRAYRVPTFEELYLMVDGVAGNVDLHAEDAWEGEVGLLFGSKRLRLEAVAFVSSVDNAILFVPRSGAVIRAENFEGVLAVGGEASLDVALGYGVRVRGDVSYARARLRDGTARRLPGRPDWSGGAHLGWRLPWLPVTVWGAMEGRSDMTLDRLGNLVEEGRVLLSAGVEVRLARGVVLRLAGRNLLDDRDAVDALQLPLPGRSVHGELRWRLAGSGT